MPTAPCQRLFVLAEALHHASMQAWAAGAPPTRYLGPLDAKAILQAHPAPAFPDSAG